MHEWQMAKAIEKKEKKNNIKGVSEGRTLYEMKNHNECKVKTVWHQPTVVPRIKTASESLCFSCTRLFPVEKTASSRFTATTRFLIRCPSLSSTRPIVGFVVRHVFIFVDPVTFALVNSSIHGTTLILTSYFQPC